MVLDQFKGMKAAAWQIIGEVTFLQSTDCVSVQQNLTGWNVSGDSDDLRLRLEMEANYFRLAFDCKPPLKYLVSRFGHSDCVGAWAEINWITGQRATAQQNLRTV